LSGDGVLMRQFVGSQHPLGSQAPIAIGKTVMPTKLGDMRTFKEESIKRTIALLIQLLSHLGSGIFVQQLIHGF
jgi:hypothetical protein